jgi:hypothetical protein
MRPRALLPVEAHEAIERLLARPASLVLTQHARARMMERRFTTDDILRVLQHGTVDPSPSWDDRGGTWTYKLSYRDLDGDPLTVVVALDDQITVMTGHD